MPVLLGIDTGGTYTDAVLFDEDEGVIATAKALTTRHDLAVGIGNALDAVLAGQDTQPEEIALVSLSTTLATNAVVEGQGGRVCLVLIGFDERALTRADLAQALKDDPVIVLAGGHDAHGERVAELDRARLESELVALEGQVSGYAVAAQFAVRNPEHETAARDMILEFTGRPVTCGHELSSKLDGPRRGLTSVLNARLINLIHHLITAAGELFAARGIDAPLMVVRGDGALIPADMAMVKPIETILSGPAASLVGAAH
ncbi:MAG: hydantoinase/oxoprolinase N-terminal domain-containing protein, partial [Hyphomicrobiales bacterium]